MKKIILSIKSFFWPTNSNQYLPKCLGGTALFIYFVLFFILKIVPAWQIISFQRFPFFANITTQSLVELTNATREKFGLNTLTINPKLELAAQAKAQDMLSKNYFAHQSPEGLSPWYWFLQSGYQYVYAGENLAINFVNSDEVINAWLNSPTHRANILNPNYKEIGIAVLSVPVSPSQNKTIIVQLFGTPRTISPTTLKSMPAETKTATTSSGLSQASATSSQTAGEATTNPQVSDSTKTASKTSPSPKTNSTKKSTTTSSNINIPSSLLETPLLVTSFLTSSPTTLSATPTPSEAEPKLPPLNPVFTNRNLIRTLDRSYSYGLAFLGLISITGISVTSLDSKRRSLHYFSRFIVLILLIIAALCLKPDLIGGSLLIF